MTQSNHDYRVAELLESLGVAPTALAQMEFVELRRIARIERRYIPNEAKKEFDRLRRAARKSAPLSPVAESVGTTKGRSRSTTTTGNSLRKSARSSSPSEDQTHSQIVDRVQAMRHLIQLAEKSSGLAKSNEALDDFAANVGRDLRVYIAGLEVEAQFASDAAKVEIYSPLIAINDIARAFLVLETSKRVMADEAARVIQLAAERTNKYHEYDS